MRAMVVATAATVLLATAGGAAAKGEGPRIVVAAFGSLWVGLGSGEVRELDDETRSPRRRLLRAPVGAAASIHGLAPAAGAIWAAASATVVRIEPRRGHTRLVPGVGHVWHLVAAAGDVWAARDPDRVLRIEGRRGRVVARIRVPGRLSGLGGGPGGVLVQWSPNRSWNMGPAGPRVLRRIDLRTNRLTGRALRVDCDQQLLVARRAVWTVDQCTPTLTRRDPRTLRPMRSRALPRDSYARPVEAFGSLWVAAGDRVLRIHPVTLRVVASIRAGADTIAAAAAAIWVLDAGDGTVGALRRIDPATNEVGRPVRVAP